MADELSLVIDAVFWGIGKRTLHEAFLDWMQRFQQYIETNGDYFEEA
jgi:hypothetical protein